MPATFCKASPPTSKSLPRNWTVQEIIWRVAADYSMPLTVTRGMASGTILRDLFERYEYSLKPTLTLLVASDLDPSGDTIANNVVNVLCSDIGLPAKCVLAYRIALSKEQVARLNFAT